MIQLIQKHIFAESLNILFRSLLPSALAAPVLRLFGAKIGKKAHIYTPLQFHNTRLRHLTVGDQCHIGRDVFLDLSQPIEIGNRVTISMRTTLVTHLDVGHSTVREKGYPNAGGRIKIGDGTYIGAGVTILHGVEIGENALIGMGALVNADVPANAVVVGVPGRVVKSLD